MKSDHSDRVPARPPRMVTVQVENVASVSELSAYCSAPHLREFLDHVQALHSGPEEVYCRRYQKEILRKGYLSLVSPFTGVPVDSHSACFAARGSTIYRFSDTKTFYVFSAQIRFGFPLAAIFFPDANCVLQWHVDSDLRRKLLIRLADACLNGPDAQQSRRDEPATIVMGHRNFAHHMWNELSALEDLLSTTQLRTTPRIVTIRETLGPLHDIFPEIAEWDICRSRDADEVSAKFSNCVNLAGSLMSRRLRDRLVRHAQKSASNATKVLVERLNAAAAPVFWLSVRTQPPTLVNQRSAMAAIAVELLRRHPECRLILDGFSLPDDSTLVPEELAQYYKSAAADSRREVQEIQNVIFQTIPPSPGQEVINAGGLGILDSIALAQSADAYFCHLGTVQHKIAWTTDAPGMIHGNRAMLATRPSRRHTALVESGVEPAQLDLSLIEDLPGGGKNVNYRAADCRVLANAVAEHLGLLLK